ncbi:LysR family transcriptional regulator [Xylocopilactobacillus apis]|uniref:LysR family transcriptional regulator n=1 Tax=Xylocopilactobacillus apis TaxID=2932183 RepID=A0AAU9DUC3_9LACO|nr:LysR family transcriptional regulator [Xylocopilactobacillus apis]BDR57438.1 LysR family transcriptional regulator [Xylocopilactobacillus apis]
MNFNDLIVFKTIYEKKTINKAAKELGYTQSNLTARLHALENECNTSFFVRSYNGVSATENGEKFYSFVRQTLSQFDELKNSFSKKIPELLTSELLFKCLVVDDQEFSIVSTKITCKKTSKIASELNKNHYDYVVTFNKLNRNDFKLVATEDLPVSFLSRKENINDLPVLINSDHLCPLRKLTIQLIEDPARLVEIDSLENISQLVLDGQATALLPLYLTKDGYQTIDDRSFSVNYYRYKYCT